MITFPQGGEAPISREKAHMHNLLNKINSCPVAPPFPRLTRLLLSMLLTAILGGCAGTSTFVAYPARINPLIGNVALGRPVDLSQCLVSECQSSDLILYNMERGRIAQIQGDVGVSMRDFNVSMDKIRENDEKAVISSSAIGASLAATAVNDNAIPYEGEGYERVLLHHYQALNFLSRKDLEGAGVEVRRANAEQEEALKKFEADLDKAREEAQEKHVQNPLSNHEFQTRYAQLDEVAGKVKNSFQNACTFYLSGFIYELLVQPNDAYIDYKKALEIYPGNRYLQYDVLRLARSLEMREELDELQARFKPPPPSPSGEKSGDLLILFEDGFVPQKQEVKIPLPVPKTGIIAIAFPIYNSHWTQELPLLVATEDAELGSTEPICDIRALAVRALQERAPVIAIRQIIRAVSKGAATRKAREKLGPAGALLMDIYNIVSENADLRSWITLPAGAQIMRTTLPAGNHTLHFRHDGSRASVDMNVTVVAGSKTIIHVVRAGGQLYTSATTF